MPRVVPSLFVFTTFCAALLPSKHLAAADAPAEPPRLSLGFFGNDVGLRYFAVDRLRRELKLSECQVSIIENLRVKLIADRDSSLKSLSIVKGRPVSDDDREKLRSIGSEERKRVQDALWGILSESQFNRVEQLALQTEGLNFDPTGAPIADMLRLSADQRTALARLKHEWWHGPRPQLEVSREQKESFNDSIAKLEKRIAEILTDDQRHRLEELQGPKADALIEEIRTDIGERLESARERAQAKSAGTNEGSNDGKSESTPPDSK
jgi:hypothetical protein